MDVKPGQHRGNESADNPIWEARLGYLIKHLRGRQMTIAAICKMMKKKKAWSDTYTRNVLCFGEERNKIGHSKTLGKWYVK